MQITDYHETALSLVCHGVVAVALAGAMWGAMWGAMRIAGKPLARPTSRALHGPAHPAAFGPDFPATPAGTDR